MFTNVPALAGLVVAAGLLSVASSLPSRAMATDMTIGSAVSEPAPYDRAQGPMRPTLPVEGMNEEVDLAVQPPERAPPPVRTYHPRYYEPEFMVVPRFRRPWHHQQHRDVQGRGGW